MLENLERTQVCNSIYLTIPWWKTIPPDIQKKKKTKISWKHNIQPESTIHPMVKLNNSKHCVLRGKFPFRFSPGKLNSHSCFKRALFCFFSAVRHPCLFFAQTFEAKNWPLFYFILTSLKCPQIYYTLTCPGTAEKSTWSKKKVNVFGQTFSSQRSTEGARICLLRIFITSNVCIPAISCVYSGCILGILFPSRATFYPGWPAQRGWWDGR